MFCGYRQKIKPKKLINFFLLALFLEILSPERAYTKDLGYCPKDTADSCKSSLSTSLNVLTNCALDRPRVKQCAMIFIQTLSEADEKAPFYEGFYEKDFAVGDVEAYKKGVASLKDYSPRAWLVLHDLSKALILNYMDLSTLTPQQKREIENLIQPVFQLSEGRKFDINDKTHRDLFIQKIIKAAKAIEWGAPAEKIVIS
jgi:hypothetical protein